VPEAIPSTVRLLQRAFPDGLPDRQIKPVLKVLMADLSDRQLTRVVVTVVGIDAGLALQLVHVAAALDPSSADVLEARALLRSHGLETDEPAE
jgi:hypothetical protein